MHVLVHLWTLPWAAPNRNATGGYARGHSPAIASDAQSRLAAGDPGQACEPRGLLHSPASWLGDLYMSWLVATVLALGRVVSLGLALDRLVLDDLAGPWCPCVEARVASSRLAS